MLIENIWNYSNCMVPLSFTDITINDCLNVPKAILTSYGFELCVSQVFDSQKHNKVKVS